MFNLRPTRSPHPVRTRAFSAITFLISIVFIAVAAIAILVLIQKYSSSENLNAGNSKKPNITISKKTTYLTSPLLSDGLPDYRAAILKSLNIDLPPVENGYRHFVAAVGFSERDAEHESRILNELNLSLPQDPQYLDRDIPSDIDNVTTDNGYASLWSEEQAPQLAAHIRKNKKPLKLITRAARSVKFSLHPSVDIEEDLNATPTVHLRELSTATLTLILRANLSANMSQIESALDDLETVYLLGKHLFASTYWRHYRIAQLMHKRVFESLSNFISKADLSRAELSKIKSRLKTWKPYSRIAPRIVRSKRLHVLYFTRRLILERPISRELARELFVSPAPITRALELVESWDEILIAVNRYFDGHAKIVTITPYSSVLKAIDDFDKEVVELFEMSKPLPIEQIKTPGHAKAIVISELLMKALLPYTIVKQMHEQNANARLTRISLALAFYRSDHKQFPAALSDLAPKYLNTIPTDPFADDKPFKYKLNSPASYTLYSIGPNATDDGGSRNGDSDDIAVTSGIKAK